MASDGVEKTYKGNIYRPCPECQTQNHNSKKKCQGCDYELLAKKEWDPEDHTAKTALTKLKNGIEKKAYKLLVNHDVHVVVLYFSKNPERNHEQCSYTPGPARAFLDECPIVENVWRSYMHHHSKASGSQPASQHGDPAEDSPPGGAHPVGVLQDSASQPASQHGDPAEDSPPGGAHPVGVSQDSASQPASQRGDPAEDSPPGGAHPVGVLQASASQPASQHGNPAEDSFAGGAHPQEHQNIKRKQGKTEKIIKKQRTTATPPKKSPVEIFDAMTGSSSTDWDSELTRQARNRKAFIKLKKNIVLGKPYYEV